MSRWKMPLSKKDATIVELACGGHSCTITVHPRFDRKSTYYYEEIYVDMRDELGAISILVGRHPCGTDDYMKVIFGPARAAWPRNSEYAGEENWATGIVGYREGVFVDHNGETDDAIHVNFPTEIWSRAFDGLPNVVEQRNRLNDRLIPQLRALAGACDMYMDEIIEEMFQISLQNPVDRMRFIGGVK